MASRSYQDMFRPAHEAWASAGWLASIILLILFRPPLWYLMAVFSAFMLRARYFQMEELLSFRLSIASARLPILPINQLLDYSRHLLKKESALYLGTGFLWGQQHAETAKHINERNPEDMPALPDWFNEKVFSATNKKIKGFKLNPLEFAILTAYRRIMPEGSSAITNDTMGVPWIHGVGLGIDKPIHLPLSFLPGHTLITGTTRAGKTRLYELISTQIINSPSALINFDPKKDKDWLRRVREECAKAGRKFILFDPSDPQNSIRINPLANFNNPSEAATRIGQLVDADGSFAAFSWKTLYIIQMGLIAAGIKPTIRNCKFYVQKGVDKLLEEVLALWLIQKLGRAEFDRDMKQSGDDANGGGKKQLIPRVELYIAKYSALHGDKDAIDGLVSMYTHSKEHFSKMIQALQPILEMLGSGELGKMLSPDLEDMNDTRPIYDMRQVLDEKCVFYVATNSLPDKTISRAIGSIMLADLASTLGAIYNFSNQTDAHLMIDEAAEVMNAQLIQILNKGGGAGIKCWLAMQTIADLEAALGSKPAATQVLGNLNNVITLRVRDSDTAKYISEMFGKVSTRSMEKGFSSGSESSSAFTEFRSNVSKNLRATEGYLVDPGLLLRLPPLQYFAFLGGRHYWKGTLPLIGKPDNEASNDTNFKKVA